MTDEELVDVDGVAVPLVQPAVLGDVDGGHPLGGLVLRAGRGDGALLATGQERQRERQHRDDRETRDDR